MNFMNKKYCFPIAWILVALCFLFGARATAATCSGGWVSLLGSYYNGTNATPVTGTPTGTRADTNINFDWVLAAPGVAGVGVNNWAARWDGTIRPVVTGNYKFQTITDDGVKLYVDGVLLINDWNGHVATTNTSATIALVAGKLYTVKMEYYDASFNASAVLKWQRPGDTEFNLLPSVPASPDTSAYCTCNDALMGGATGSYYNLVSLTGAPANTRLDPTLDFSWAGGTPGVTGIGTDLFSVRWNATFRVATSGTYYFQTLVDDGVKLYVNNLATPIIDSWIANSGVTYTSAGIALAANTDYPLRLEYFEGLGNATIRLQWKLGAGGVYKSMTSCPTPVVDHYGISLSSPAPTCAGAPITITAYDLAGSLITPVAGTQVTLTTSPGTGVWAEGSTFTFTGAESSFVKHLQQTTPATLNINVTDGVHTESALKDLPITFVDTALTFYGSSALTAMQHEVAGTLDPAPVVKAGNCTSQITGAKNVSFAYECINPTSCVVGQIFRVNNNPIQANGNAATIVYSAAQSLTFDASGIASIPLYYSDVGKVKIYATMTLPATVQDPAITLTGNSGDIVFKPHTIALSAIQTSGGAANPGGTSAVGAAAGFVAAGTAFTAKVEVRNSEGHITPNFGKETPTENNIKLVEQSLIYPGGGTLTPLANATIFTATTPVGTFINSTISWNQVGSITATPSLADNDYLGAGDLASKTISGTIGRFYPDHFTVTSSSTSNSCPVGGFSFLEQHAIGLSYSLQAQSATNAIVTNYGGNYATPSLVLATIGYVAENADSADGNILTPRLVAGSAATWVSGEMTLTSSAAAVLRKPTSYAPDGPFSSLQWGLTLSDAFDGRSLAGKNMDALSTGPCAGGCTAVAIGTSLSLRYGRLRLEDAGGPETTKLPVNFLSEYWRGSSFTLNPNDSCTVVPPSAITYPGGTLTNDAHREVTLSSGAKTIGNYNHLDGSGVHFSAGNAGQFFSAPSPVGTGAFTVGINLSSLPWLRYDWNQNNDFGDITIPNATFTFGHYRGRGRIIYWREKMN